MRDHLLGCAQFIPDVENEPTHFVTLRRRYPLGTPSRVNRDLESHVVRSMEDDQQITAFEEFDHTPAGMMADFPREYDMTTMLNEAAGRRDFVAGGWGKSLYDLMQEYDEQVQRQCGINDMVLNANKSTHVGVDLGKPGDDMYAMVWRRPEVLYSHSFDDTMRQMKAPLKVDTYPTSAEIKDFYKRAALSKVEDWERMVFEGRLALGKPTAQQ